MSEHELSPVDGCRTINQGGASSFDGPLLLDGKRFLPAHRFMTLGIGSSEKDAEAVALVLNLGDMGLYVTAGPDMLRDLSEEFLHLAALIETAAAKRAEAALAAARKPRPK